VPGPKAAAFLGGCNERRASLPSNILRRIPYPVEPFRLELVPRKCLARDYELA
jgi:hypothetical protein